MAGDAAAVLRAMDISSAHVAGFSGGSLIAQELALHDPELVKSLVLMSTYARVDPYLFTLMSFFGSMPAVALKRPRLSRSVLPMGLHAARARQRHGRADHRGDVSHFPHPTPCSTRRGARPMHSAPTTPTTGCPRSRRRPSSLPENWTFSRHPASGTIVAERIPNATFQLMPGEAHQPFQESPDDFNARVDEFWRTVDAAA